MTCLNEEKSSLSENERREFDNVTYDEIQRMKDVDKLRKLEAYMRQEGFEQTSETARQRLKVMPPLRYTIVLEQSDHNKATGQERSLPRQL